MITRDQQIGKMNRKGGVSNDTRDQPVISITTKRQQRRSHTLMQLVINNSEQEAIEGFGCAIFNPCVVLKNVRFTVSTRDQSTSTRDQLEGKYSVEGV